MTTKTAPLKDSFDIYKEAMEADLRIRPFIRETPLEYSPHLSQIGKSHVHLKLENFQKTGSFKLRGALNKLLSLTPEQKKKGIITASSGNHGIATAYGLNKFNIDGKIYLPETASEAKVNALRSTGAPIDFYGDDCVLAEIQARKTAEKEGKEYISAYNDVKIIHGQATVAVELLNQMEDLDSVLVPVGGGGLISGIAGYLKSINPAIEIFGCQPFNSPVMYESVKAGQIIDMVSLPTLSEGSAGGIEEGSLTFPLCQKYVDDYILVTEDEIKEAVRTVFLKHYMIIEGAAALSVASYLKEKKRFCGKNAVLILSGSKLSEEALRTIFCQREQLQ